MTRIRVTGRIDGAQGGTVIIDRERELITVKPRGRRCKNRFTLPLSFVAEIIVAKVVKQEMERAPRKRRASMGRG